MNIKAVFGALRTGIIEHSPEIYTGAGIGLSILTAVTVGKRTPYALELLKEKEKDTESKVEPKEKIEAFFKAYWPALALGAASITLIICGQRVQLKRTAAATAAYILAQDSLEKFTSNVVEELGTKKVRTIKDNIASQKINENPVNLDCVLNTGTGDTLCYDAINGRYFYSSIENIRKAEGEMNRRLIKDNFVSLNEFYIEIGLPSVKYGDELGWDVGLEGVAEIDFSSQLDSYDRPCLVVDSDICPRWHVYA